MNILEITRHSDLYNFHSHTQFCDGHAPMADFVPAAIQAGFTDWGFSPHSPLCVPSGCNMSEESVPEYLREVKRLKEEYAGQIRLYASMEIDYLGPQWGPATEYFQQLPLDYRIGSVHFIPNQEGEYVDIDGRFEGFRQRVVDKFDGDIRFVVDKFYEQSIAMIEACGFDIIGHFDKIGHNAGHYQPGIESEPWYQRHIDHIIEAIAQSGIIAEINTKALADHRRFFPGRRFWPQVIAAGIPLIVNSDAHYPALINAGRPKALELLRTLNLQQSV